MAPKSQPIHIAVEHSIQAEDPSKLLIPNTIIWAKLRGYPWWPGRVKGFDEAPRELASIAKTHYKDGTVVAVYFFGSHDFSLVPTDALRPFEPNWELFSGRSTAIKFKRALMEARDPDQFQSYEKATLTATSPAATVSPRGDTAATATAAAPPRRRGRPPKHPRKEPKGDNDDDGAASKRRTLRMKKRPRHYDATGAAAREHLLYCRIKLQKILLRPNFKDVELPIAEKILGSLAQDKVALGNIAVTKIALVLRLASQREELAAGGKFANVGNSVLEMLRHWRSVADQSIAEMGL